MKIIFPITLLAAAVTFTDAFTLPHYQVRSHSTHARAGIVPLQMAVVTPETGTAGILGRGYISVICAKLAALRGYKTWMITPPNQEEVCL